MKADYFSDLLPDSVTSVTSNKPQAVTPSKEGNKPKNSDLQEALPVLPLLPGKTGNTEHDDAIREHLEERAAIMEYDGGLTRAQAETEARRELRVYEYKLTDNPDAWLVLIAPGCDLEEVRKSLSGRFGSRLLDIRKHSHV